MTRKSRKKLVLGATVLALLGVAGVAYAAEEEPLFCTGNASHECVFGNGNKWTECASGIEDGERYLGLVAAQVCETFVEA